MYHGVYEGPAVAAQEKKILILGESHHDLDSSITTQQVVEDYLSPENTTKQSLQFFHKIALAFGVDTEKLEEKARLWDKVYFGNYVDESLDGPSGEGDKIAKKLIAANKERYNQDLAEFIKTHEIDTVFCFSFLAWDEGLPPAPALVPDVFKKVNGRNINLWCARAYGPDSLFGRRLEIYGVPHPRSWIGFGADDIVTYLKPVFEDCCG